MQLEGISIRATKSNNRKGCLKVDRGSANVNYMERWEGQQVWNGYGRVVQCKDAAFAKGPDPQGGVLHAYGLGDDMLVARVAEAGSGEITIPNASFVFYSSRRKRKAIINEYEWFTPHRKHKKEMHALHGNGVKGES